MVPKPMSPETVRVVKSTQPVIKEHGTAITSRMYEIMFKEYPDVKNLFNKSHFVKYGEFTAVAQQPRNLANSIFAFVDNLDDLSAIGDVVDKMANKHVSFHIMAEHYPIVGDCVLKAMKDVLGDAATPEILGAWEKAYNFLADLLIEVETELRNKKANQKGGWEGYKAFQVTKRDMETPDILSLYLAPVDGGAIPEFEPGQYLSFRFPKGTIDQEVDVVRNYSISCAPGAGQFRVSIKKEKPDGAVSNHVHTNVKVGDKIEVGVPCGEFTLKNSSKPIVLIGSGIGITPLMSMLETIVAKKCGHDVTVVQCLRNKASHPMKDKIESIVAENSNVKAFALYSEKADTGLKGIKAMDGKCDANKIKQIVPTTDAEFYFTGSSSFLDEMKKVLLGLDVPKDQLNYEYFGPTLDLKYLI